MMATMAPEAPGVGQDVAAVQGGASRGAIARLGWRRLASALRPAHGRGPLGGGGCVRLRASTAGHGRQAAATPPHPPSSPCGAGRGGPRRPSVRSGAPLSGRSGATRPRGWCATPPAFCNRAAPRRGAPAQTGGRRARGPTARWACCWALPGGWALPCGPVSALGPWRGPTTAREARAPAARLPAPAHQRGRRCPPHGAPATASRALPAAGGGGWRRRPKPTAWRWPVRRP